PGYIVGPDDPSGRFTYWPVRIDRGGEVLAPGAPSDPVQIIDVRDLGVWLITLIERGTMGTFNAAGPKDRPGLGRPSAGLPEGHHRRPLPHLGSGRLDPSRAPRRFPHLGAVYG
ncbi:MAG: hypothetical protein NTW28_24090, partial [Candidatus Solibacter sp.]|nr:hypothetical protein [Candidatus Solibacter sp.]